MHSHSVQMSCQMHSHSAQKSHWTHSCSILMANWTHFHRVSKSLAEYTLIVSRNCTHHTQESICVYTLSEIHPSFYKWLHELRNVVHKWRWWLAGTFHTTFSVNHVQYTWMILYFHLVNILLSPCVPGTYTIYVKNLHC